MIFLLVTSKRSNITQKNPFSVQNRGFYPQKTTKYFVLSTFKIAKGLTHEVAAAFLLGREDVIPSMFKKILAKLKGSIDIPCNSFRFYLERHTHIDEQQHAPMGEKLLRNLCGNDSVKWSEALSAAKNALYARQCLWDGVSHSILAELFEGFLV